MHDEDKDEVEDEMKVDMTLNGEASPKARGGGWSNRIVYLVS